MKEQPRPVWEGRLADGRRVRLWPDGHTDESDAVHGLYKRTSDANATVATAIAQILGRAGDDERTRRLLQGAAAESRWQLETLERDVADLWRFLERNFGDVAAVARAAPTVPRRVREIGEDNSALKEPAK